MWAHKWAGGPMPEQYVDLLLCERFGWSPEDLYDADPDIIEEFLVMWDVESGVKRAADDAHKNKNK